MKGKENTPYGLGCGEEIANILKKRHPEAQVYALYRSAVAIEYDKDERVIKIFTAGDPHVWGRELVDGNVEENEYAISGDRFAPNFYEILFDKAVLMKANIWRR